MAHQKREGGNGWGEVYAARDGFRIRLRAANGKIISQGESYTRKHDAVRGIQRVAPGVAVYFVAGRKKQLLRQSVY